ncbi:MAG: pyruvate carboxylase [Verrucomicrobiota bacterium]|jgi:pyruvate carboxylase|nr:pyruvate carboxylase [Verrucomicrobiota bacterium]
MKKLLVANRSEIAVRIFRSASELNLRTVAIYAEEDRFGVHRFKADEAYLVGKGKGPVAAYLDIESIISIAKEKRVDMIHPGYGFLSENADFARACEDAGIVFIGPRPELLESMGDKVAAKKAADAAGVPTLPATPKPVSKPAEALRWGRKIGFPLIIKAAFGGGGRGMRVVQKEEDLKDMLEEAQGEAERAFGNPAVFLERYVGRAKHLEVQVLGDRKGNVVHLHERDCSVQRRYQKVVEVAPSIGLPDEVVNSLCGAGVELANKIGYDNAGTVEFLLDQDTNEWFFIEMNPRIQVEHTVTEQITGIDIVRSQILVAMNHGLHDNKIGIPQQNEIPRNGCAIQCRVTTEDPEKGFTPDYGKILSYRSAAGFGVRLDGAMGDTGSIITPFYDSLLVKITASGPNLPQALDRMHRALREMRIRGVKTNIPFLENVINHKDFVAGKATTRMIDVTPSLFKFKARKDRASKLLSYLGEVIVNGNPQVKGRARVSNPLPLIEPEYDPRSDPPRGTRDMLLAQGPVKFSQWLRDQKSLMVTDTTLRDAHQSLFAARMRSFDMLAVADFIARRTSGLFSLEMWGGATFDTCMRFLGESPYERLRTLREKIPNVLFQMLLRGSNAVGYANYPDNVVREFVVHASQAGMDVFRIFDSLNYLPNLKVAMEAVNERTSSLCEAAVCFTGDFTDSSEEKYTLDYYVHLAKELEKMGAHILAIKDMAGLCHPVAASRLVKALRNEVGIPIHFHTHDSSGIASASVLKAAEAGVDVVDLAISSLSGCTSQPNLNSVVHALRNAPRSTGLDVQALNELSIYWEAVRQYYSPFDTSPPFGSAEVFSHQMPGGQYTNLREQATSLGLGKRWPDVVKTYEEVNALLGDVVKVTPSSKSIGDLAIFLITKGVKPEDLVNLPSETGFPQSVIDLVSGNLGQPKGGWPKAVQKVILGKQKPLRGRPGASAPKVDLKKESQSLKKKLGSRYTDDDLFSSLMYPQVYNEFQDFKKKYGDVSVLPTTAYFHGLEPGEEISIRIEEGKTLFIKLLHVGDPDEKGIRSLTFELNGKARTTMVQDKSVKGDSKAREKADPSNSKHVAAPIPAMISSIATSVGKTVAKGDKIAVLEAMKMQTTLYASSDGTVDEILVKVGDSVESKDLIARLR